MPPTITIKQVQQVQSDTLEQVVAAREAVAGLRDADGLTAAQMRLIDNAYTALNDLEDLLELKNLSKKIQAMNDSADNLGAICDQMKKSVEKLKQVAKIVDLTAKAVGTLVQIVGAASSAGIL